MLQILFLFKRYQASAIVGLTGIAISFFALFIIHNLERNKDQKEFQQRSTILVNSLQKQLDSYNQLTRSVSSFFNTSGNISLQEFKELSNSLLPYYNGLLGLGWAEKVEIQERFRYEQKLQKQGLKDFTIREFDNNDS